MTMMKHAILGFALAAVSATASALPLVTLGTQANAPSNSTTYSVPIPPGINNFAGALTNLFGPTGLNNWTAGHSLIVNGLGVGDSATITFDYFGSEAGGQNWLTWRGADVIRNQDFTVLGVNQLVSSFGAPLTTVSYGIIGGVDSVLPFGFRTLTTGGQAGSVNNQGTGNQFVDPITGLAGKMNFIYKAIDSTSGILMLDDDGNLVSDNHDDMVFRVTVSVPAPGIVALLGIGALGFAATRRKRAA
jgi:hypothetical protein